MTHGRRRARVELARLLLRECHGSRVGAGRRNEAQQTHRLAAAHHMRARLLRLLLLITGNGEAGPRRGVGGNGAAEHAAGVLHTRRARRCGFRGAFQVRRRRMLRRRRQHVAEIHQRPFAAVDAAAAALRRRQRRRWIVFQLLVTGIEFGHVARAGGHAAVAAVVAAAVPHGRVAATHDVLFVIVMIGEMAAAIVVFIAAIAHVRLNAAAVRNLAAIRLVRVVHVFG